MQKKKAVRKPADRTEHAPRPPNPPVSTPPGFHIVGIGASAGGLAAFEAFFSALPPDGDPGMAFVLVQHLDPHHKSILTELIRRYTRMEVFEVTDGMTVRPNCTYIIPPNHDMAFLNGALQLLDLSSPRGPRLPIDFFFRSLAQDQHERAIGIILSGTGNDGVLGVRAIKGEGGMVMAQTPASTEFDGMPRSAIATGLVDFELLPAEMPARLIAYTSQTHEKNLIQAAAPVPGSENALKKILILLRSQTGHDFSLYKPNTINRRIERRMAVHQIDALEGYVRFLQQTPAEVDALFRDMLIGVTSFFRDTEAYNVVEEQVMPRLFADRRADSVIRIWTPACSTGEEAYSLAMLLAEHQEALKQTFPVQVFATDIDTGAIAVARSGKYPASIAADVSPQRLARFFTPETDGSVFRIHKRIRDMVVFSEQDVIKDPPFSRLDLISCRNLMIYMGSELQKKLIPLFHYALNPDSVLFLGTSESVGEFDTLFSALNRSQKVYLRKPDVRGGGRTALGGFPASITAIGAALPRSIVKPVFPARPPLRELTEQALLRLVMPAGALVDSRGDILYLHGRTGMYLEPASGEAGVSNILKMAREGLRRDLTTALYKAVSGNQEVRRAALRVKTNGHYTMVDLAVHPVAADSAASPEAPLYLVVLAESADGDRSDAVPAETPDGAASESLSAADARIEALKQELQAKEEYLQSANEELETSNEELRSSNEEMQSVNEELQSTNEELETSKEELQSVNEELSTVNNELQTKVVDLSRVNNDMNNLLAGTGIGTVFVDMNLHIMRFTPATTKIINLIVSDIGRPVGHIVSNLAGYATLVPDVKSVLDTLVPKEVQVQTIDGAWYTMRVQPYRTLENVIEGAVITFEDITEIVRVREELRAANNLLRLAVVVRDSHDAVTVQDLDGRIIAWNQGAVRMYGWSEAEALVMNVRDRIPQELREGALETLHQLSSAAVLEPYRTQRITKDGRVVAVSIISTALVDGKGKMYAIATTERAGT